MARVSMIVWNTFQNDARVLKEAETLAGQGHRVTVFALLQPGETPEHEVLAPGLEVVRVSRTPLRALRRLFQPDGSRPPRRWRRASAAPSSTRRSGARACAGPARSSRGAPSTSGSFAPWWRAGPTWCTPTTSTRCRPPGRRRGARGRGSSTTRTRSRTDREGYRELRGLIAWAEKRLMPRADATITTTEMRAKFFARAYGVPRPLVLQNRPRFAEPRARHADPRPARARGRAARRPLPGRAAAGARARGPGGGDAGAAALPPRLHRRRPAARRAQGHGRRAGPRGPRPLRPHGAARRAPRLDRLGRHRRAADPQHLPQPPQHRFQQALRVRHGRAAGGGERLPRDPPGGRGARHRAPLRPRDPGRAGRGPRPARRPTRACGRGSPPTPGRAPGRSAGRRRRRSSSASTSGCWPAPPPRARRRSPPRA